MIYLAAFLLLWALNTPPAPLCETEPTPPAGLYVDLPKTGNTFEVPEPKTGRQFRYNAACKTK